MDLLGSFIRQCKRRKRRLKVADSRGTELTGGRLLAGTLVLRRLLRRNVLNDNERYVGLLLPSSVGGFVANVAVSIDRRIAVNLNYTVAPDVMNFCIKQCGIRHVLTSEQFIERVNERFNFDLAKELDAELVYLEHLREKASAADKLIGAFQAYAVPAGILQRFLGLHQIQADDVLTVIFTSGSTGTPKGAVLTYSNVASNVEAINQVVHIQPDDMLIGILPFFHSFGYTVTMWTAASLDLAAAYHFDPLDGRQIGKLCERYGGTLLLSTPTFLRTYLRRCTKEQFATLDVVVAGAEKLPKDLSDAFEEKFGVRPVEGYGTTELSPLVSVNIPASRAADSFQTVAKEGTVGRPVPGVSAKITDLDTGQDIGTNQSGMLWIKGPNVMRGYLDRQDLTDDVINDGWYKTGDVAQIDDDGFITITGRESRFSKIGGEMVPHIKIEEALTEIIAGDEEEGLKAAVTAVPDAKKGERLIVIHTKLDQTPDQLCKALAEKGLPNIFIPSTNSFCEVEELPILGTGKLDLKGIQQIAKEKFSAQS